MTVDPAWTAGDHLAQCPHAECPGDPEECLNAEAPYEPGEVLTW